MVVLLKRRLLKRSDRRRRGRGHCGKNQRLEERATVKDAPTGVDDNET
jgi:hypothetical protein